MLTSSSDKQVPGEGVVDWGLVEGLVEVFMAVGKERFGLGRSNAIEASDVSGKNVHN